MRTLLFCLLLLVCISGMAQQKQTRPIRLDEHSVVQDAGGQVLPYNIWQALMQTGSFAARPLEPDNPKTAFKLVPLTDAEKEARLSRMPKPAKSAAFTTGKKLKLFSLKDMEGNKLDLRQPEGKVVVLNFWFINCPPCRKEIPELNKLVAEFKANDSVVFVAIALDHRAELKNFLREMPFDYQIIDNGLFLAQRYGVQAFPTHVVLNTKGEVYFHTQGLAPNTVYWLRKSVLEALKTGAPADTAKQEPAPLVE